MRIPTRPRNGAGFTLGKNRIYDDSRLEEFSRDGHIDPNNIRREQDPEHANPNDFSAGSEGISYKLPKSAYVAHDNVGLIQLAHQNYVNYKTRFNLPQSQPQGASMPESNGEQRTSIPLIRGSGTVEMASTRDQQSSYKPSSSEVINKQGGSRSLPQGGTMYENYRKPVGVY